MGEDEFCRGEGKGSARGCDFVARCEVEVELELEVERRRMRVEKKRNTSNELRKLVRLGRKERGEAMRSVLRAALTRMLDFASNAGLCLEIEEN